MHFCISHLLHYNWPGPKVRGPADLLRSTSSKAQRQARMNQLVHAGATCTCAEEPANQNAFHAGVQQRLLISFTHLEQRSKVSSKSFNQLLHWCGYCVTSQSNCLQIPFERLVAWAPSKCIQAKIQSINHPKGNANFRTDPNFMESAADSWGRLSSARKGHMFSPAVLKE